MMMALILLVLPRLLVANAGAPLLTTCPDGTAYLGAKAQRTLGCTVEIFVQKCLGVYKP